MKLTLYMAISTDGYIAKKDHDTSWVCDTDWEQLKQYLQKTDAVIMGRRAMEVSGEDFPYESGLNVVLTHNKRLHKDENSLLITDKQPEELVATLAKRGVKEALLIGGGKTNTSFLEAGVINEVVWSVHPLVLGNGIKVFAETEEELDLELLETRELEENLVQLRYRVI